MKIVKIVLGTILVIVVLGVISVVLSNSKKARSDLTTPQILDRLAEAAWDIQGTEAGPGIIISGAKVKDGQELTYYYRVPRATSGSIDRDRADEKALEMKREVCDDRMVRQALDGGAVIRYVYRNDTGREIYRVELKGSSCSGLS